MESHSFSFTRSIPTDEPYDLIIAGGGPAGTAAAIAAGRLGAKVLLLEATGCLGGMGTSGLVCAFDPMADGERNLVGGIQREIVETLHARGELPPQVTPDYWMRDYHRWTPFHPESLKCLLDELTAAAGVEVRLFTRLIEAETDPDTRTIRGVVAHNIEGLRYIPARTFIDATGDAVLAERCGVECRTNPAFMPGTLCAIHAGIDWSVAVHKQAYVDAAIAEGHFTQPDRHVPGLWQVSGSLGYVNAGHLFHKDALRARDLSEAMAHGRRLAREYLSFYRNYVPGCREMELVATGALLGVRETRRIVGEYTLAETDYQARRQFPDQIGIFNKHIDIHVRDCTPEEYERFEEERLRSGRLGRGECFGIPYGILVPKGWTNLWVAGRCNSSDEKVHGSIRVMPAAAMMGQAAGTAAVQAIQTGQPACALDTETLITTLRANGANLPQPALSQEMTRA